MKEVKLQKYPAYKDSGVEWLGEIPKNWEILPSKRFHKVNKQPNSKRENDNVLSLTLRGVVNNNPDSPEGMVPKDYGTYQIFEKDNLVFKLIDLENVKTSRVGIVHEEGIMSSAYIRLVIGDGNIPRFAYYYFYSLYLNQVYNNLGTGVRSTLGPTDLLNIPFLKPTISEQTAIANFLEIKTTQIENAIAIKQKQIELLKERRQILIHRAVTRGLNPDIRLKDSGVEWIGEIPEHWEVKALRYIGKTQNGISKGGEYFGSGFPFVNYGDVYKDSTLPMNVVGLANSSDEDRRQYSVLKGDIFFTRTSETVEEIGFSSVCLQTIENAIFSGFLIRFRPSIEILNEEFSKYYFRSKTHRPFFVKEMNLVIRASLSQELLKNMPILLPPLNEQMAIAKHLDNTTTKISTAITLKEKEIGKLKEYKSVLINEAVSGKIKVK